MSWVNRRVQSVRRLDLILIISLILKILPRLANRWQDRSAVLHQLRVWHWLWRPLLAVEDAGIALIEVATSERSRVPRSQRIMRLGSDETENVGTNVPAAEGMQIPVRFHGGKLRVVVVKGAVGGSGKRGIHGVAEENGEDFVLRCVGFVLVKSDEYKGVIHEVGVVQEGLEK